MSRIQRARASQQGWLLADDQSPFGSLAPVSLGDRVVAVLAESGPLTEAEIVQYLPEGGDVTEIRRELLSDSRIVMAGGGWTLAPAESAEELQLFDVPAANARAKKGRCRRPLSDRAELCLTEAGHPLTLQALVDRMGGDVNVESLKVQLFSDDRFIRSDVSEWALRCWGMRRYTSVRELVSEEVDGAGGSMSLDDLQRNLARDFTIKAPTLRQVASTAPFTVSGGLVRRLNDASGQSASLPEGEAPVRGGSSAQLGVEDASADEIMGLMGL
ncbi:hypothetical protein [Streptomyces sp. MP131-18]|uniref:hypothetical protein n=1 Tax=Streptomyces sp. MP131-18 TaxID=1857892 RepID=UPI00097C514E|nr:hypothetical protein [Streptomyces sp. MP131-18]ONK12578.1 hypothetical protein STBA_33260 [Streptomyces sp. MP131-18]